MKSEGIKMWLDLQNLMPLTSTDYIQIIVAIIYAVALYYTVITFKRSKELDQIRVTETIFNDLRQLDRELSTLPSSSQDDQGRKELYSRILNTVDWLSFLINTKVITDRRMMAYMKPTLIQYYQDTFVQNMLADERYSNSYHHFRSYIKEWNRTNSLCLNNPCLIHLKSRKLQSLWFLVARKGYMTLVRSEKSNPPRHMWNKFTPNPSGFALLTIWIPWFCLPYFWN